MEMDGLGENQYQDFMTQTSYDVTEGPNRYLRSIDELPMPFQSCYLGSFRYFNSIQSNCFADLFHNDHSIVISAPTGSGKTVLMELAILRLFMREIDPLRGQFFHQQGLFKVIYLAPAKALVSEKVREWTVRFGTTLNLKVREITGDTEMDDFGGIDTIDIICTTPEKFDAMTRRHRSRGSLRFFNEISLVLIDEVHLLSESRGSSLEAGVVSRIKMVSSKSEMIGRNIANVRFVAVSATIPNAEDLAIWLGAPVPKGVKVFGEELRPVKLKTTIKSYCKGRNNDFMFEKRLNSFVWPLIRQYSRGKPTLVFCSSRKSAESTAIALAREVANSSAGTNGNALIRDYAHYQRLCDVVSHISDNELKSCILNGIGYHNAALSPDDRVAIETLFRNGDLLVLCATSTLAVGVNLPAFLVIVKGTRRYVGQSKAGGYDEYDRSTVLQMIGRAGRPQFDTEGCAVIMTEQNTESRYTELANGNEEVNSTLMLAFAEFLNAEIVLGTIPDVAAAIAWLCSTFFYVRVRNNPSHYAVPKGVFSSPVLLEQWLRDKLVLSNLKTLAETGMIRFDDDNFSIEPLQPGIIMAENYVRMPTMINICKRSCPSIEDLIWIIAKSDELNSIILRRSEKKVLNACNKSDALAHHVMSTVKAAKVSDKITTAEEKIFVLINRGLADKAPEKIDYSLRQDTEHALNVGARLCQAFFRYFLHKNAARETFNALILCKSLKQKLWPGSLFEVRQIPGVGPVISQRLATSGIHSIADLCTIDARRLESLAKCPFPWGNKIQESLRRILPPHLELKCQPISITPPGIITLQVEVIRKGPPILGGCKDGNEINSKVRCPMRLIVGTVHDNALLLCRYLCANTFNSPMVLTLRAQALKPRSEIEVICSLVHERVVGIDKTTKTTIPLTGCSMKLPQQATNNHPSTSRTHAVAEHHLEIPQLSSSSGNDYGSASETKSAKKRKKAQDEKIGLDTSLPSEDKVTGLGQNQISIDEMTIHNRLDNDLKRQRGHGMDSFVSNSSLLSRNNRGFPFKLSAKYKTQAPKETLMET